MMRVLKSLKPKIRLNLAQEYSSCFTYNVVCLRYEDYQLQLFREIIFIYCENYKKY
jgi:hypothetical protein